MLRLVIFFILALLTNISMAQPLAGKISIETSPTYGDNLYHVMPGVGVYVYDFTSATDIIPIGFINIPGVLDIAPRGPFMYCSAFDELLLLKVNFEDEEPELLKTVKDVFPSRAVKNPDLQVAYWTPEEAEKLAIAPSQLTQGSMSRLALKGDFLYAANNDDLITFKAEDLVETSRSKSKDGDGKYDTMDLETIHRSGNQLYLGTPLGVEIFSIDNPSKPVFVSKYQHTRSCDPVVVLDKTAYSTMRDGSDCGGRVNQLTILNVSNPSWPRRIKDYPLHNPHGLDVTPEKYILIADGAQGLKVIDARNPSTPRQIARTEAFFAYDVIYNHEKKVALVSTGESGVRVYDLSNPADPRFLQFLSSLLK